MNESIVIGLIQNIAILLAFAMLYENFWLRNDSPRGLPSKIFTGFILGGIGIVLMNTPWTMMPGLVFDTRSVMMAISGLFFGAVPTIIAMAVAATARFIMGGEGMWMGMNVIVLSGTIGILWGKLRKDWRHKNMKVELLLLGIVVHAAMLASVLLLPPERIVPTLKTIAIPVMLIHTPGTMLLGLIMAAQKNHMENRLAKAKLYNAEHQFGQDLLMKQKQLHKQVNKYAKLTRKFKDQNNELKTAKEKAEESDRLKSSFLANLSHEIRTPMNAIIGFTDLLELNDLSKAQREKYVQIIRNSGEYLLGIINDIIEISHIESGQVEMKVKEINVRSFLEELFSTLKFTVPAGKNLGFRLREIPDEVPARILADEVKLKQIIINLLNNAFKFTQEGEVSFGCCIKEDGRIAFFVKDSGIGIDSKNHQVIFERFRQVENRDIQKGGGSGLGLAIVRAYVDLMGGSIEVESEPGKGSEFLVSLPLLQPEERQTEMKAEATHKGATGRKNFILVAEDEEINWLLLHQILTSGNYMPVRAANGREAVELCRKNDDIDLVLMDIKMPEMNGFEAREEIRRFKPALPVIAQTAYALPADVERLKKTFSDYVTKPINRQLLIEKIESVRKGYERREEPVTE